MSLFQSNLRKQIRNLPKILNFVKKIHYYSELFTSLLDCIFCPRGPRRGRSPSGRTALYLALPVLRRRSFVFEFFWQKFARFWPYRHRSLQENSLFKIRVLQHFFRSTRLFIYLTILKFEIFCKFCNICNIFAEFSPKLLIFQSDFLRKF